MQFQNTNNVNLTTDQQLHDINYLIDLKVSAYFAPANNEQLREFFMDTYRDFKGYVIGFDNEPVWLQTNELEIPHWREWARDFRKLPVPGAKYRIRCEAFERVRVISTILKMRYPEESKFWGKHIVAANDNNPDSVQ